MKLSKNFTLAELTLSATGERLGLANIPDAIITKHLQRLTDELLQPMGELLAVPVLVMSGYRCLAVNKAVGGSKTSAHMHGYAADFTAPKLGTPYEVALFLSKELPKRGIKFDQIICEFNSWVHIGLCTQTGVQRGELLTAKKVNGKTKYLKGIVR